MKQYEPASRSLAMFIVGVVVCLHAGVAFAQDNPAKAKMINVIDTSIYVRSDNFSYAGIHRGRHPTGVMLNAGVFAAAPEDHRINSWKTAIVLQHMGTSYVADLEAPVDSHSGVYGESYASKPRNKRPRHVVKNVLLNISSSRLDAFANEICNANAQELRQQGLSNQEIFGEDRIVRIGVFSRGKSVVVRSPKLGTHFIGAGDGPADLHLVCMKGPAPAVDAAGSLQTNTSVTDVSLTVLEQSTLGGACKVNLSTVVRTNLPNTEVRYRFEHTNGAKSDIKQVVTSHSSTAMDAHWYDVPLNPQGPEAGSVRVVGVSHDFQSDWKTYSMTCNAASPGDVATTAPPTQPKRTSVKPSVELSLEPTAKVMHRGMICPTKVKVTARLHSKMPFTGTGLVAMKQGNHAFGKHDVQLTPYIVWQHEEEFDLKTWSAVNASTGMAGGAHSFHGNADGSSAPPTQRFELRYVLTNNEAPVVTTPYKTIAVSCTDPQVNARIGPATDLTINRPDRPQHVKPGQLQLGQQRRPDRPQPVEPVSPKPQQQVMTVKPPKPTPRKEPVKPAGNQMKQGQSASGPQMRARAQPGAADRDCKYDPNSAVLPCADGKKRMKLINPFE